MPEKGKKFVRNLARPQLLLLVVVRSRSLNSQTNSREMKTLMKMKKRADGRKLLLRLKYQNHE